MPAPVAVPVPSAAVVLLRPRDSGFEVLLVRRSAELAFHGGAWVFPGGRIDDHELRARPQEITAARLCAVRELAEEAGVTLPEQALRPLACWTTPEENPRRFRAWFFIAEAPAQCEVRVDGEEIHDHQWLAPHAALAAQVRGELDLPPPVFTTLTQLSACGSADHALAMATEPPPHYEPRSVFTPQGRVVLYAGDAGYATRSLDATGPRDRLWLLPGAYRYERSE